MSKNNGNLFPVFSKGLIKENPVLRLVLGTCPTLAVTTSAINGIGMGLAATFVLVCSGAAVSLLRKIIPDKVRIPAFITIIAGFVTIVQMLMKAYLPAIDKALGIFLPLIVVNCIILARAEMFASKNPVLPSILDGLGMGLGFTATLTVMGAIRELLGAGSLFGLPITAKFIDPMLVMILPPGGFFVFGVLVAVSNALAKRAGKKPVTATGCQGGCAGCPLAAQGAEAAETAEITGEAKAVSTAKTAKTVQSAKGVKQTKTAKAAEKAKTVEETKAAKNAEAAEKAETAKAAKPLKEVPAEPEKKPKKPKNATPAPESQSAEATEKGKNKGGAEE